MKFILTIQYSQHQWIKSSWGTNIEQTKLDDSE